MMWTVGGKVVNVAGCGAAILAAGFEDVPGQWLVYFVLAVWASLGIAEKSRALFGKRRELPQPLLTEQIREMASREEVEGKLREVWDHIAAERKVARDSQGRIHHRIDQVSGATAKIQGQLEGISAQLNRIEAKGDQRS